MTDETNCTVYGISTGMPNLDHLEPNEDLSVELVDKNEAKRILREENLSVKCLLSLIHFIQSDLRSFCLFKWIKLIFIIFIKIIDIMIQNVIYFRSNN